MEEPELSRAWINAASTSYARLRARANGLSQPSWRSRLALQAVLRVHLNETEAAVAAAAADAALTGAAAAAAAAAAALQQQQQRVVDQRERRQGPASIVGRNMDKPLIGKFVRVFWAGKGWYWWGLVDGNQTVDGEEIYHATFRDGDEEEWGTSD